MVRHTFINQSHTAVADGLHGLKTHSANLETVFRHRNISDETQVLHHRNYNITEMSKNEKPQLCKTLTLIDDVELMMFILLSTS